MMLKAAIEKKNYQRLERLKELTKGKEEDVDPLNKPKKAKKAKKATKATKGAGRTLNLEHRRKEKPEACDEVCLGGLPGSLGLAHDV